MNHVTAVQLGEMASQFEGWYMSLLSCTCTHFIRITIDVKKVRVIQIWLQLGPVLLKLSWILSDRSSHNRNKKVNLWQLYTECCWWVFFFSHPMHWKLVRSHLCYYSASSCQNHCAAFFFVTSPQCSWVHRQHCCCTPQKTWIIGSFRPSHNFNKK